MKKFLLLPAVFALFIGCVTTTENGIEEKKEDVSDYPLFEVEYYDLVQFENDVYDRDATEAAVDLLLRNHPVFKEVTYDTPDGAVTVENPYHDADAEDDIFIQNSSGNINWDTAGARIGDWHGRYRSIIGIVFEISGGTSRISWDSILEQAGEITPFYLGTSYDEDEGRWRAYDYKNLSDVVPFDFLEVGEITYVNDPGISKYSFAYYIPKSIFNEDVVKTVFLGHSWGSAFYDEAAENLIQMIERYIMAADEHGYVLVAVTVPQRAQYLSRSTMMPGEIENDFWARPDLEYVKVIDALMDKMEAEGVTVHRKVFMTGTSTGGQQANIFPILHPEYVEASAPGAAGTYLLPFEEVDGVELFWPVGLADADRIEGFEFDAEEYKTVEQFIFVGGNDTNDPAQDLGQIRAARFRKVLGSQPFERVEPYAQYLADFGADVKFEVYEGFGHEFTDEMCEDVFEFFDSIPIE